MTVVEDVQAEQPADRGPIRVLLADDASDVRLLLRMSLEADGFVVVAEAENGAEAVALTEAHLPDVLVLDVAMPVMDGLQALTHLQRRCPQVPVIMYSGFSEGDLARRCLAAGARAYAEKQGDTAPLARLLRQVVLAPDVRPPEPAPPPAAVRAPTPEADGAPASPSAPAPEVGVPQAHRRPAPAPARVDPSLLGVSDRWALPLAVTLFALITVVRLTLDPADASSAISMLYVTPVCLLAARSGLRGGLLGAAAATLGVSVWLAVADAEVGVLGFVVRMLTFTVTGAVVGLYADRVRQLLVSDAVASSAIVATNRTLGEALEQYRSKNVELEAANADLRQFGYIVSHDLAEPLRTMSGFATLLEEDHGDALGESGTQYLAFIRDGANRMKALIDDLRAYTRAGQQELQSREVALGDVVDDVVAGLGASLAERHAEVRHSGLPTVVGDRSLLGLVLQNLISNGVKFNDSAVPQVTLEARRTAQGDWEMDVRDNGIGIDPRHSDRVFILFGRLHTRTEYPGTGLGLAICRRIVERHRGSIAIVPSDAGTCMRVVLPGAPTGAAP